MNRSKYFPLSFKTLGVTVICLLGVWASIPVSAHGNDEAVMGGGGGEESGTKIFVNGHELSVPATMDSDFTDIRIPAREVAEALKLPTKWDPTQKVMIIGENFSFAKNRVNRESSGNDSGSVTLYLNGRDISTETDPLLAGNDVMVRVEPFAKELGLSFRFDTARHAIVLVSGQALRQFEEEETQVRNVLLGKGMEPHVLPDGTKEFTLTAELHDWAPVRGVLTTAWTFNGQSPGPTIRVTEGDHVRIRFVNKLPEPTTIHWHGLHVPNDMDGVPYVTQPPIPPGKSFVYEFTASHPGTFIYHSHYDDMKQIGSGLYGALIVDPKNPPSAETPELTDESRYDHDYTIVLGGFRINTDMHGEEDYFTMNGRSYPDTPQIEIKKGKRHGFG